MTFNKNSLTCHLFTSSVILSLIDPLDRNEIPRFNCLSADDALTFPTKIPAASTRVEISRAYYEKLLRQINFKFSRQKFRSGRCVRTDIMTIASGAVIPISSTESGLRARPKFRPVDCVTEGEDQKR